MKCRGFIEFIASLPLIGGLFATPAQEAPKAITVKVTRLQREKLKQAMDEAYAVHSDWIDVSDFSLVKVVQANPDGSYEGCRVYYDKDGHIKRGESV